VNGSRSATALAASIISMVHLEVTQEEMSVRHRSRPGVDELDIAESCIYIGVSSYCSKTGGGPLIRLHFRLTFTSTRLAILMKGMLLFMP